MGWFWADTDASIVNTRGAPHPIPKDANASPPPACPMHQGTSPPTPQAEKACPVKHAPTSVEGTCPVKHADRQTPEPTASTYSKYNPLNYMYYNLSQERAPEQTIALPVEREPSSIPKGSGEGNWEYPSPQQMYNALLRKGGEVDPTAVESMVSVHNFLNEGAWAEIVEWERRFSRGLGKGWEMCKRGEEGSMAGANLSQGANEDEVEQPKLIRFMGRPKDMTPKAAMVQVLGWIYPSYYATEPPFDRHDWFVQRKYKNQEKEVRYVIDYYSGPDEPNGEPVFYLDVRPALTPTAAVERMMRWGGDVWYRASGASVRGSTSK